MGKASKAVLLVFGSINLDLIFSSRRHPLAGETILGAQFATAPGGKGANQAVAAAKDAGGLPVAMVGAVGIDAFSQPAIAQLVAQGVDLKALKHVAAPTGTACICVEENGENRIIVASGANQELRAADVPESLLQSCSILLMQNEIDPQENLILARQAKALGKQVILNAAPARALDLADWTGHLDVLIVNEGELASMSASSTGEPVEKASILASALSTQVVVTLGAAGVLAVGPDGTVLSVPALPIKAIDTTGAGDTFCGVLSAALARDEALEPALRRAAVAGSLACLTLGAQTAIPTRQAIEAALSDRSD